MILGFFLFRQVWKPVRLVIPFLENKLREIIPRKKSTLSLQDFLDDPRCIFWYAYGFLGHLRRESTQNVWFRSIFFHSGQRWRLVGEVAYCRFHPDFVTGYYWILLANIRHRRSQPLVETVVPMVVKYIEVYCGWNIGPGKWWSKLGRSRVLYQGTPLEMTS